MLLVDLTNLSSNLNTIRNYTKKELMVVLKSNAYNMGSIKLYDTLKENNIKWIFLNKISEYFSDYEYLKSFKVLLMESPNERIIREKHDNLYFSVNNINDAILISNIKNKIKVHLQIDTGMNRLGLKTIVETKKVIKLLDKDNIEIDGIYTHFASNQNEFYIYEKQYNKFIEFINLYPFNHIHANATSSLHKKLIGNIVRVGLAIYGYGNNYLPLLPTLSLYTKVQNRIKIKKGEFVGYDQAYRATKNQDIITIPIGYDDIKEVDHVFVNNLKCAIIGKICMNHMQILLDDKIKKLTKLLVLSKRDIIGIRKYNWYHILASLKKIPKCYMKRSNYDLPRLFKTTNQTYRKYQLRKRSY